MMWLGRTAGPINVIVDGTQPVTGCSFGVASLSVTGSGVLQNPDLSYTASDNCGGSLTLTVETFSNEYEDFNSQEMIRQYQHSDDPTNTKVGMYVAATICSTNSNGQCIQDP